MRRTVAIKSITTSSLNSETEKPWTMAFLYLCISRRYLYASRTMDPRDTAWSKTKPDVVTSEAVRPFSTIWDLTAYVAAWTGLECIGTAIDRIAHPYGPKAPCKTCGNVPGEDRDRKKVGIGHMFCRLSDISLLSESLSDDVKERLSKELTGSFSSTDAQKLRDAIVHGLEGIESLVYRSSESRLHPPSGSRCRDLILHQAVGGRLLSSNPT